MSGGKKCGESETRKGARSAQKERGGGFEIVRHFSGGRELKEVVSELERRMEERYLDGGEGDGFR